MINTSSTEEKMLFTSIPFEKGWTAKVDGQKTEIVSYQDAFISIPLSAGEHTIELSFTPPGWKAGLLASGVGVMTFLVLALVIGKKKTVATVKEETDNNTKTESIEKS